MSDRGRREERRSLARRRAETHASGFQTTTLVLPDNVSFYQADKGKAFLDILPYKVGKGNPNAEPGEEYYERTFFQYRKIGIEEKNYVCPSLTFGEPDPIQEWRQKEAKKTDGDSDRIESLKPKERQLFLVYDRKNPEKGVQLWDCSYFNFGKELDSRIRNSEEEKGWDWFYKTDERGLTLEITFEEAQPYKQIAASAIDFSPRKTPIPENIVNHKICLDDILVKLPYEELRRIFLAIPKDDDSENNEGRNEKKEDTRGTETTKKQDDDDIPFDQGGGEPPAKEKTTEEEIRLGGELNFKKGGKVSDNPFKKDTPQYKVWRDGWMAAMEAAENEAEKEKKPDRVTVESLGLKRGDEVYYEGKKCSYLRVSEDGETATLLNSDDEPIKASVSGLSLQGNSSTKNETKEKEKGGDEKTDGKKGKGSDGDEAPWDDTW